MAKTSVRTNPVVYLELSAEEAVWLKAYMQNSIGSHFDPPSDYESQEDRTTRKAIFEALPWGSDLLSCPRPLHLDLNS
jgi:hypothetical protein